MRGRFLSFANKLVVVDQSLRFPKSASAATGIGSQVSRKLGKDVGWLWAGYVGRSLAYLGLTIVLIRSLGVSGYGELALFLALTLGVSQVAGSWPFLAVPVLSAHGRTIAAAFRPAAHVAGIATAGALAIVIASAIHSNAAVSLAALAVYSVALIGLQGICCAGFQPRSGRIAGRS